MSEAPAWVRLQYHPPNGTHTPVFLLERYWHAGTTFTVPAIDLSELDGIPGFTVLGFTESPIWTPRRG